MNQTGNTVSVTDVADMLAFDLPRQGDAHGLGAGSPCG